MSVWAVLPIHMHAQIGRACMCSLWGISRCQTPLAVAYLQEEQKYWALKFNMPSPSFSPIYVEVESAQPHTHNIVGCHADLALCVWAPSVKI